MNVWIVGRFVEGEQWQFQGVFSLRALAIDACRDETYFVGPAPLDEALPHDVSSWPDCIYPKAAA